MPKVYAFPLLAKLVGFGSLRTAFPPARVKVTSEVSNPPVPSLFVNTSSSKVTMIAVLSAFGVIVFTRGPAKSFKYTVLAPCVVDAGFPEKS